MFPPATQHHLPPSGHKPTPEVKQTPVVQFAFLMIGAVLLVYSLRVLDDVLLPLVFSGIFSLLLLPICRWLELKGLPRVLAIILCLLLLVLIVAGVVVGFGSQLAQFKNEIPKLQTKTMEFFNSAQEWAHQRFGYQPMSIEEVKDSTMKALKKSGGTYLGTTLNTTTSALSNILQVFIYIFCLLLYRDHLRQFMFRFVAPDKRTAVLHTVDSIQTVVQAYISGLVKVIIIVAVLNGIGLVALGVKFAVFFAIFASVLAVIPYIGIMIGATIPAIITLVETGSIVQAALVIGVFVVVQFLEGNFITPMITGSQVSINPLAAILALILGNELWGTPGMILSIPIMAVIKVVLDASKVTEPWGFLLGDTAEGENSTKAGEKQPGFLGRLWGRVTGKATQ
ncbi:putative PurR-regulated permease PerM [Hymenobacter luteus]|uniref:PurR-regulated permease PerM n=2 Tax=Hymenobacter TaxID=89966 RepID=A0ABR6JZ87_9BACT|nr:MULTISPECIES: AI-2E family transporter [Hymenobacter]MBB4602060.1 putative PurR-regulated permease PerM [Hymenobacter latericoloratus]MBB6059511.1 putative PurR-regulated permease PerM [Hymenobacter luteus]